MGNWQDMKAVNLTRAGKPDIKKDLDMLNTWMSGTHTSRVLESVIMKGTGSKLVYFAAVERMERANLLAERNDGGDGRWVFASVILIEEPSDKQRFAYSMKQLDEYAAPAEHACPGSIIERLSAPKAESARIWREECMRQNGKQRGAVHKAA